MNYELDLTLDTDLEDMIADEECENDELLVDLDEPEELSQEELDAMCDW